eukprot:jgi/Chlat1/2724/Chrsp182S08758
MSRAEAVSPHLRAVLGESPSWDGGVLRWIDVYGPKTTGRPLQGCVYTLEPRTGATRQLDTGGRITGTVVPLASGGLLVALENTIETLDEDTGALGTDNPLFKIKDEEARKALRFNDGKCDAKGRLWIGTINRNWRDASAMKGALHCLSSVGGNSGAKKALALRSVVEDATLSNGLAWSPDGTLLYWTDSVTQRIDVFDFDVEAGEIKNRRTAISIPKEAGKWAMYAAEHRHSQMLFYNRNMCATRLHIASENDTVFGLPDGLACDARGRVWVAQDGSGAMHAYDPAAGGVLVERLELPVKRPTACTFGGVDLSELYVTTREEPGDNPSPHAGNLIRVHVPGVRGAHAAHAFAG